MTGSTDVEIRAATAADAPAVLELLRASMGWVPDDQHARFFHWKHRENPHGASPAWVAVDPSHDHRIVGFRTFLRWQFRQAGHPVQAVRAVDTATHPDLQGRGIFSLLTRHALAAMADTGPSFVYNTPNHRSLPGYLKLGWQVVGRPRVASRPRSPLAPLRLLRARTPADKWSTPTPAGVPAVDALAGLPDDLISPADDGDDRVLSTDRSREHLLWRYGFAPLHYRALPVAADDPAAGTAIFRLRRRGPIREAAVCEMLLPDDDLRVRRSLLRRIVDETGADHAVMVGPSHLRAATVPVPGQGPTLAWRALPSTDRAGRDAPALACWKLTLGDVELF